MRKIESSSSDLRQEAFPIILRQNPASREPGEAKSIKRAEKWENPAKFEPDPLPEGSTRIPRGTHPSRNHYPHPNPFPAGQTCTLKAILATAGVTGTICPVSTPYTQLSQLLLDNDKKARGEPLWTFLRMMGAYIPLTLTLTEF